MRQHNKKTSMHPSAWIQEVYDKDCTVCKIYSIVWKVASCRRKIFLISLLLFLFSYACLPLFILYYHVSDLCFWGHTILVAVMSFAELIFGGKNNFNYLLIYYRVDIFNLPFLPFSYFYYYLRRGERYLIFRQKLKKKGVSLVDIEKTQKYLQDRMDIKNGMMFRNSFQFVFIIVIGTIYGILKDTFKFFFKFDSALEEIFDKARFIIEKKFFFQNHQLIFFLFFIFIFWVFFRNTSNKMRELYHFCTLYSQELFHAENTSAKE